MSRAAWPLSSWGPQFISVTQVGDSSLDTWLLRCAGERKGWETELSRTAADPECPCHESFSAQAGLRALHYFYISLLTFFSSCPGLDVEGLDVIQEIILVAFAFWLHSRDRGESWEAGVPELRAGSDSRDSSVTPSFWEMSPLPESEWSRQIPLAFCAGLSLYFLHLKKSFKLGFQFSKRTPDHYF